MLRLTVRLAVAALAATAFTLGVAATPAYAVAPDTVITAGPEDGALVLPGPVQYTFASVGPVDHFDCSIDNGPFATCTTPQIYNLGLGTHVFRVRAVNAALEADQSPATRYWVVRNVPCEQAGEAYAVAQGKYFEQQHKLVKAKRQLHQAHNHGSAVEFQQAKNKVRKIKAKIKKFRVAMNAATAQEYAVCRSS